MLLQHVLHSFEAVHEVAMASSSTAVVAAGDCGARGATGEIPCICLAVPAALPVSVSQGMDEIEVIESFRTPLPLAPTAAGDLPPAADAERPIRSGAEFVYGILSLIPDVELLLLLQVRVVVVVVGR